MVRNKNGTYAKINYLIVLKRQNFNRVIIKNLMTLFFPQAQENLLVWILKVLRPNVWANDSLLDVWPPGGGDCL